MTGSRKLTDALDAIPRDAFAGRRCLVTGGLGFIGSNLALALLRHGAEVTVLDARVPRHGSNPWNLVPDDGDRGGTRDRGRRGRSPRRGPARRPRSCDRRRVRVQPRRSGEPRRLDGRSVVRSPVEHHQPVRVPRSAPPREPVGASRVHVDASALRQAALPPGRRGPPGRAGRRQRDHEVRDRAAPPPVSRGVRPPGVRGAAHQRLRTPAASARQLPGLPPDLHPACARRRDDHRVRRRPPRARLPLRRRRRRVPAARGDSRPMRRVSCSTWATTSTSSCASSPQAIVRAAGSGRVEHVDWPSDRDAIDIGSYFGDSSKAKRMLGWEPRTSFAEGIEQTIAFYRSRLSWYV